MGTNTVRGKIVESLPNLLYRVELEGGRLITCYVAGKLKLNKIKLLIGDSVAVVLDPYKGNATNRIIERLKGD